MTKEIRDIIVAFKAADQQGRRSAFATVVHVEGSSYRSAGARMLVEENGKITGAISGGCLEGDALRKALQVINLGQNKLVTYNTLEADDLEFGVQLGCNGIVHILFEPIDPFESVNPITLLEKCCRERQPCVIVTMFSLKNYAAPHPGTCCFFTAATSGNTIGDDMLAGFVVRDAADLLAKGSSQLVQYSTYGLSAFYELLQPAVSLIVIGAGNDALPLVNMATTLGWQITIVDGRATHATKHRFPNVHNIVVGKPAAVTQQLQTDNNTAIVLMTHNYHYDKEILQLLLPAKPAYIGTLGPKKRLENMLAEISENGMELPEEQIANLYGPVGLDIGAETPEEIALSILSEIKAVFAGRNGGPLRLRQAGIHARPSQTVAETQDRLQHTD